MGRWRCSWSRHRVPKSPMLHSGKEAAWTLTLAVGQFAFEEERLLGSMFADVCVKFD